MSSLALTGVGHQAFDVAQVSNVIGWYKADAATDFVVDGATIGTMADSSPAGRTLTQGTAGARPTWRDRNNGINGWPALSFDGGDSLVSASGSSVADLTIFAVIQTSDVTNARSFAAANASQQTAFTQLGVVRLNAGSAVATSASITASVPHFVTAQFNQTASFARVDGTQSANVNPGSNSSTVIQIGTGGGVSWSGLVAEVLFCSTASSAADITYVETYLRRKYRL